MMYLFTIFSPTSFSWYPGHIEGNVFITKIQLWLTVSPSLHNN